VLSYPLPDLVSSITSHSTGQLAFSNSSLNSLTISFTSVLFLAQFNLSFSLLNLLKFDFNLFCLVIGSSQSLPISHFNQAFERASVHQIALNIFHRVHAVFWSMFLLAKLFLALTISF
jgi:hypothetical protein